MLYRLNLSVVFFAFFLSFSFTPASASSIKQMSVDELIENAELVFEGRVLSAEPRWNKAHTLIKTFITFEVIDVLSGEYTQSKLKLGFVGGKIDQDEVKAQGLRQPEVGEKGIYFIESLTRPLVNPLVGWSQGQFLLEQNDLGNDVVMTDTHDPVVELTNSSVKPALDARATENRITLSRGVAQGVVTKKDKGGHGAAMSAGVFKKQLKARMLNTRQK